jgi:parvulin-like peptidyl-prolyl isomerase
MKRRILSTIVFFAFLMLPGAGMAAGESLPRIEGKEAVATVNGEPITLDEFKRHVLSLHRETEGKETASRKESSGLLERMIDLKLIIQEGRNIGLDALPEVEKQGKAYESQALRNMLFLHHVRKVKVSGNEIEKIYREMVKELNVKSVLVKKVEDVKLLEKNIKAGGNFDELVKKMIAEGKAEGKEKASYVKIKDLLPLIAEIASKMKVGEVSPVIKVGKDYTLFKLVGVRYPEDPEARDKANREALRRKRLDSWEKYGEQLKKKYVKVNKKILDDLDFEAKEPGFDNLRKDGRTVAEVKGENPVSVGQLTEAIRGKFYHDIRKAIESKKVNEKKTDILNEILLKKVFTKEAVRLKIDKTEDYQYRIQEHKNGLIFGSFLKRVIDPDIKIRNEELKAYYDRQIAEYSSPEMMRIDGLMFAKKSDAEDAIGKLRKGADFQWIKANAPGRVESELPIFTGKVLTTRSMPEEIRKAVSGSTSGEYRVYAGADEKTQVLFVKEVIPPRPKPFPSVRKDIAGKVFEEKRKQSLELWVEKLRAASQIKVFAKDQDLRKRLIQ